MHTASIFAEAIRRNEPIDRVRDRLAARDHVLKNYPAIALPALRGAMAGHRPLSRASSAVRRVPAARSFQHEAGEA